jgi:phosphoribosylformylglycinamidine cyclo-ligase
VEVISGRSFLFSPDCDKKVSGNFASGRITTSKLRDFAYGKRLATGAVALQRIVVKKAYARAGVDVDLANKLKRGIGQFVRQTHGPQVLGKIGGFGGLFRASFPGMRDPVLVASIDGVGTKLKIAFAMNKHDTIGADLVNHCVNDIAVLGARPLFFLDYIGCEKLEHRVFQQLLRGFARACRSAGCVLLGGETAQMPGMYRKGEYDLAGCIVGVVDRAKIIDGQKIKPGDVILGLASNGLHTNGYSLAREILFRKMRLKVTSRLAGSTTSVGEELLRVHKNYQPLLANLPGGVIKGLAHVTGGGLIDNLPRILPPNCDAVIETRSWRIPPIFQVLEKNGKVDAREMYQVFNMGIGMVAVVAKKNAQRATSLLRAKQIGTIERGSGQVRLEF